MGVELGLGGGADGHAGSVVEEEVEGVDVVDGLAAHEGVDSAGVVADHAAEGAAAVGGGVGCVGEGEVFGGFADAVEDDAGLDVDGAGDGIDRAHLVHVLGEVEDDGGVAALAGERGSCSAGEDGRVEAAAEGDGGDDVVFVEGDDEADGDVAVVGGVGGVEGAGAGVEADLAADFFAEAGIRVRLRREIDRGRERESWGGGQRATWMWMTQLSPGVTKGILGSERLTPICSDER